MRNKIRKLIENLEPFDEIEANFMQDGIDWIDSGVETFRIEKPATPPKHLVCYTVIFDPEKNKILLLNHKKAELLLPSGGHMDKGELPHETAIREIKEELNLDVVQKAIKPNQVEFMFEGKPFFFEMTETVGKTAGHIDVNFWFVFRANSEIINFENSTEDFQREFRDFKWYSLDEILEIPIENLSIHMHRFVRKLKYHLQ